MDNSNKVNEALEFYFGAFDSIGECGVLGIDLGTISVDIKKKDPIKFSDTFSIFEVVNKDERKYHIKANQ